MKETSRSTGLKTAFTGLLAMLLMFGISCTNDPVVPGQSENVSGLQQSAGGGSGSGWPSVELLDTLDYEEFSGTLVPGQGGALLATMATWPKNCIFSIIVPPEALPDDDSNPVLFSLRVPTYQSYMEHASDNLPLIIRLEPSNINFHVPVMVMGTYMPWDLPDAWEYWTIDPLQFFGDVEVITTRQGRKRVLFDAPHFSDWMVGDDDVPTWIIE